MSHAASSHKRDRIEVGFVEADVEIGFSLVDIAHAQFESGDTVVAARVLEDCEDVFRDIQLRLSRMGASEQGHFAALLGELRREVDGLQDRFQDRAGAAP